MKIRYQQASAGSGKTYSIEHDLCDKLIAKTVEPGEVIAVTFTKKAANELKSRIVANLLAQQQTGLATAIINARIGTVHGIFGGLLTDFAFELGLAPDIRVIDDRDKMALLAEALDQSIPQPQTAQLNHLAQRLNIENWQQELLAIIELMRANNLEPDELAKFANHSVTRLMALLPLPESQITEQALRDELDSAVTRASHIDKPTKGLQNAIQQVGKMLNQATLQWQNWVQISKLKPTKQGEAPFANAMALGAQVLKCPAFQDEIRAFIKTLLLAAQETMDGFAELKAARGLVDFTDQERLALTALETPTIVTRLKEQVRYLIVDEFQDTSPLQLALFSKLSSIVDDVLLVGDAKQAIYGFRGSDPKLALDVLNYVQDGGGQVGTLPNSWRSRPGLVHWCNELFTRPFSHLLTPQQVRLTPTQNYHLDSAELEWWKLDGKNIDLRLGALAVGIREHFDAQPGVWDKTQNIARPIQWRDIAVLCRSNKDAAKLAEQCVKNGIPVALERAGLLETPEISLALACLRRLIDPNDSLASAEILSLVSGNNAAHWLDKRIAAVTNGTTKNWNADSHPILSRLEAARADIQLLSPKEAVILAMQAGDIQQIVVSWDEGQRLSDHRLANLARLVGLVADYEDHCNAQHLAGTITGFVLWLRELEQRFADHQASNPGDAVNISTYHGAKGLEWPVVICAGLDTSLKHSLYGVRLIDNTAQFDWHNPLADREICYWPNPFPGQKNNDPLTQILSEIPEWHTAEQQAKNEAIQLLYVGMTRARDQLVLTEAGKNRTGDWLKVLDSPFLSGKSVPAASVTGGPGSIALPSGEQLTVVNKVFQSSEQMTSVSSARKRHWLPPCRATAPTASEFICPPSSQVALPTANATIIHAFGHRITLNGSPDMAAVGEAIHHALAIMLTNKTTSPAILEEIIQHWVPGAMDAAAVHRCGAALIAWINTNYPKAKCHTELPFSHMLPTGQLQTGQIDLALDVGEYWIIIDHKSNPQPQAKWCEIAKEHSGQLSAYAAALEKLSGKPVKHRLIHFSVSGGLVEVV